MTPFRSSLDALSKSLIRQVFDAAPASAINLGLGMPDLPVPKVVSEAVAAEARSGSAPYTPNAGMNELRALVARRYGADLDQVVITAGVQEGLFCVLSSLAGPGDEILVPDPGFPAYAMIATVAGASAARYACGEAEGFRPTAQAIEAAITPHTRAVVLNSPGNPTGAVLEDAEGITALLRSRGIPWVSDEIYDGFVWRGQHAGMPTDGGFVLSGLSKTANLMGWRLGWVVMPGDWAPKLTAVHQSVATCASRLSQVAGIAALKDAQDEIESNAAVFGARRDRVHQLLSEAGMVHAPLDGAFYAFLKVEGDDVALAYDLLERGVITIPGTGFGPGGAGWLRIAYTTAEFEAGLATVLSVLGAGPAAR